MVTLGAFLIFSASALAQETSHAPFAVIGDTQRTLWVERVFLGREQNDDERPKLIQAILDEKPSFLIHLGDMVDWGGSKKQWRYFDELTSPLKNAKISIIPVVGNHEYFSIFHKRAQINLAERFRETSQNGRIKIQDRLALIFLNSNQNKLGKEDWTDEQKWLETTLQSLDQNSAIDAILVFAHHPAYTNSKTTGDEESVDGSFVPAISHSPKTIAYISGHAHGFEHFIQNGKHFIVSGGGGGPRVDYHTGSDARHTDLYQGEIPRPFNFLMVQAHDDHLSITVKGFEKGEAVHAIDQFQISYFKNP